MLKKSLYILLIISISGLPNLAAIKFIPHKCCCSETQKDEPSEMSCCSMKHEENKKHDSDKHDMNMCNISKMSKSSLSTCGCVHEYTSTGETTLINTKDHSVNSLVLECTITEQSNKKLTNTDSVYDVPGYRGTVPIYISVSSYLI